MKFEYCCKHNFHLTCCHGRKAVCSSCSMENISKGDVAPALGASRTRNYCMQNLIFLSADSCVMRCEQDFYELFPQKFQNKTNGVTPRRWLAYCNPGLSKLITDTLGSNEWIAKTDQLTGLRKHADDKAFQKQWRAIKLENKQRLADLIKVKHVLGFLLHEGTVGMEACHLRSWPCDS